jgi:hypothetical protein
MLRWIFGTECSAVEQPLEWKVPRHIIEASRLEDEDYDVPRDWARAQVCGNK